MMRRENSGIHLCRVPTHGSKLSSNTHVPWQLQLSSTQINSFLKLKFHVFASIEQDLRRVDVAQDSLLRICNAKS